MARLDIWNESRVKSQLAAVSLWPAQVLGAILASSLARNAYALMSSIVVTSILGMLFWILAGRLFDQTVVGIGGVLINTAVTLSVITRLSLNNVLQRFLPGTGRGAGTLVFGALAIGGVLGCVSAFAFALFAGAWMDDLAFLSQSLSLALLFSLIVAVWSVYSLLESTLSGLRSAHWVPVFSISSSVFKIGMLVVIALVSADAFGLLAAWTIPILPAIAWGTYMVFAKLLPGANTQGEPLVSLGAIVRFCSFDYFAGLAPTIAIAAAPLIVLKFAGAEGAAQYYIGWLIAYSVYLLGHSMGISLLTESVVARERIASLAGQAIVQAFIPIAGGAILIALLAPFITSLFGPKYEGEGTVVLQLLVLSCIPWTLETIFLAVARAKDWLAAIFGIQWLTLVLALSLGLFLAPQMGASGMALAWLIAQSVTVSIVAVGMVFTFGFSRSLNTVITLSGALNRIVSSAVGSVKGKPPRPAEPGQIAQEHDALAALRADPKFRHLSEILPKISTHSSPSRSLKPGTITGLQLIETRPDWRTSLAAGVDLMAQIHAASATTLHVSEAWTQRWIALPIDRLQRLGGDNSAALAAVERHMMSFWADRMVTLGTTHGDLGPGSFLFTDATDGAAVAIRQITNWSHVRPDGPAGLDLCHLGLTTRMAVRGQELGTIVHDLLHAGTWSQEEHAWLAHSGPTGDWLRRDDLMGEMVLLAWITHLARNLESAAAYRTNRVWRAINLDWPLRQARRYVDAR